MRFTTLFIATAAAVGPIVLASANSAPPANPANPANPVLLDKMHIAQPKADTVKDVPLANLNKESKIHEETADEHQQLEENPAKEGAYFSPSRGFLRGRQLPESAIHQKVTTVPAVGDTVNGKIYETEGQVEKKSPAGAGGLKEKTQQVPDEAKTRPKFAGEAPGEVEHIDTPRAHDDHLSMADVLLAKKMRKAQQEKQTMAGNFDKIPAPPKPVQHKQASRSQIIARLRNGKRLGSKPSPSAHFRY